MQMYWLSSCGNGFNEFTNIEIVYRNSAQSYYNLQLHLCQNTQTENQPDNFLQCFRP